MTAQELLNLPKRKQEKYIKSLVINGELYVFIEQVKNEFMLFIKDYLSKNKPTLTANKRDSNRANFDFIDSTYGTIHIIFQKGSKYYRYYVASEKLSKIFRSINLIAATPSISAIGTFNVRYNSNGITKHFSINVGEIQ